MPIRMTKEMEPPSPSTDMPQPRERRKIMWELSEAKYDLSDLILDRSTASQLLDVISYFHNRTLLFETWGLGQRFPQQLCLAVNLYGPPGTGKTMAAHAIAKAVAMPLLCVDYAEIESKYVGETSKNLSDLFHTAQEKQAVIFFDEADALLPPSSIGKTSGSISNPGWVPSSWNPFHRRSSNASTIPLPDRAQKGLLCRPRRLRTSTAFSIRH